MADKSTYRVRASSPNLLPLSRKRARTPEKSPKLRSGWGVALARGVGCRRPSSGMTRGSDLQLGIVDDDIDGPRKAFIEEDGHEVKLAKLRGAGLWQFAYREPTQP
jgi:hypothetical protein